MHEVGDEVVMRQVRAGETVELMHVLAPVPSRSASASGSLRPLPRYVEPSDDDRITIVADLTMADGSTSPVGVGVLSVLHDEHSVADLQLFVVPPRRHRGLGSTLFKRLVELARTRGIRRLRLRLPEPDGETFTLLTRLSIPPTVWEAGGSVFVEFPTAAF